MKVFALLLVISAPLLGGCGKSDLVAVRRPVRPIWICAVSLLAHEHACRHRFDAGSLVGLRLPEAERLAAARGYNVRRVIPLAENEMLLLDRESRRLDVETDSDSEESTVVRFVDRG